MFRVHVHMLCPIAHASVPCPLSDVPPCPMPHDVPRCLSHRLLPLCHNRPHRTSPILVIHIMAHICATAIPFSHAAGVCSCVAQLIHACADTHDSCSLRPLVSSVPMRMSSLAELRASQHLRVFPIFNTYSARLLRSHLARSPITQNEHAAFFGGFSLWAFSPHPPLFPE